MTNKWCDFEYFSADEANPIGKYTQPKQNPRVPTGRQGYPSDDIDREGTMTYGRYIKGKGDKKNRIEMRGYGAAERGRKFYDEDEIRPSAPPTTGD